MHKILVSAYAVAPDMGSEPGMGWNWISRLSGDYELFVITEGEFRPLIDKALETHPNASRMHFYYNPVSERVRKMCWNQGDWRFYLHYRRWQRKTLEIARAICAEEHIDLIHQLNMIGFREPGYLWKIPSIPYLLGPVNCKFEYPFAYWADAPWKERLRIVVKDRISRFQLLHSRRFHQAVKRASAVVTASSDSKALLRKYLGIDVQVINETGASIGCMDRKERMSPEGLDILWVGRLNLYSKLPGLAVQSLAAAQNPSLRIHFVGPGDDTPFRDLARKLGVEGQCRWYGGLPHREVLDMMGKMDLLLFTSVVEGTPHVVLESIACGLPVVCFNTCGQGDTVDDSTGIRIPLTDPGQSALDFAGVLNRLAADPEQLSRLSAACKDRIRTLSWETLTEKMTRIYDSLMDAAK